MIIEEITVTAFQQHTRILGCEKTKRAICIDPGDDSKAIVEAIDKHGFELQAIAVTHAHLDPPASAGASEPSILSTRLGSRPAQGPRNSFARQGRGC